MRVKSSIQAIELPEKLLTAIDVANIIKVALCSGTGSQTGFNHSENEICIHPNQGAVQGNENTGRKPGEPIARRSTSLSL